MDRINRFFSAIIQGLAVIGALGLLAIAILVSVDVGLRFFTGRPITGTFEFASILLVGVTFLPMAAVLFTNQQLRVDIILEHLKGRVSAAFGVLDAAVGLIVFGLLLSIATEEFEKAYNGRFLLRGIIEIPTWIPTGLILIGTGLSVFALLLQGIASIRRLLGHDSPPQKSDSAINPGAM